MREDYDGVKDRPGVRRGYYGMLPRDRSRKVLFVIYLGRNWCLLLIV